MAQPPIPVFTDTVAFVTKEGKLTPNARQNLNLLNTNATSGGSAPANGPYITSATDPTLTNERVLTSSTSNTVSLAVAGQAQVQRAALTGDVTASANSNATTIANDAVTFAKMQNIATQRLIGRNTAGTGDPEEVTISQALDWLP